MKVGCFYFVGYDVCMLTAESIRRHRDAILEIASRYGAHDVRIFGSVARGDSTESSDLDLLVRFDPSRSLFDHGGLLMDLQDLLGVKVDVISEGGLNDRFRNEIARDAIPL